MRTGVPQLLVDELQVVQHQFGALAVGLAAGWLLAQGRYAPVVAGSVLGWVASMLDGVDGEETDRVDAKLFEPVFRSDLRSATLLGFPDRLQRTQQPSRRVS